MGLVATWLNGIGLSSAVPTFTAAGIVTPAALAELDVAHFEALGVADPDDRRKLFYLVQRIKMAVNKDKNKNKQENSMEDQVVAVISGSSAPTTVENPLQEGVDKTKQEIPTTHSSPLRKNRKNPIETVTVTEPRRSRRLASKQQQNASHAKENLSAQTSQMVPSTHTDPPAKPMTTPIRTSRGEPISSLSAQKPSSELIALQQHDDRRASDKDDQDSDLDENNGRKSDRDDNRKAGKTSQTSVQPQPNRRRDTASRSRAKAVFNIQDEDEDADDGQSITRKQPIPRRKSGLKTPKPVTTSDDDSRDRSTNSKLVTPSKTQSTANRRPESKLQNPGKSMRTGKVLSSVPSESVAPMSPLVDLPSAILSGTIKHKSGESENTIAATSANSQLRGSSSVETRGNDLDALLQSSVSDLDSEIASDSESSARIYKRRSKSFGIVETSSDERSRSVSRHRPRQSSGKVESAPSSVNRRNSSTTPRVEGQSKLAAKAAPIVHGGTQSESWATKIEYLREDNEAEHELFRDQGDQKIYEYDMRIRVIVRKRPVSKAESKMSGGVDVIHPLDYGDYGRILVYQPKTRVDLTKEIETVPFAFDNVFDESSTNLQIYNRSLRSLIVPFFQGKWSTVFAYGQTGSGKTYTMMGSNMTGINAGTATEDEANLGLYYLAALDIFEMVRRPEYQHLSVQVSLFEIYGGKLFDLLNARKQVKCLEDSKGKVCFPGLTEHPVQGPDDLMELIEVGAGNRSTGTTSRNADSSRSHAVLQLKLRKDVGRRRNVEHGRLNFIDLAGSERGADTSSASRATRLEGAEINTSLLALKEVIRALATGGSMTHIPFRGSKLTQVLKDSFVGEDSRCCMVACVSPDIANCEQTLNTLRYADRVKERNSESGALSNGYEQPTRLCALDWTSGVPRAPGLDSTNSEVLRASSKESEDGDDVDSTMLRYDDDPDTDAEALDELLCTSLHESTQNYHDPHPSSVPSQKRQAGESLVAAHRLVMSKMLTMVKDEMTLVNTVDADRDGLDDYLVQLETMQATQLDLIANLRDSLSKYVTACELPLGTSAESDDESFEDLRD